MRKRLWQCVKIPIISGAVTSADLTNSELFSHGLLWLGGNVGWKNIFCSVRDLVGGIWLQSKSQGEIQVQILAEIFEKGLKLSLTCSENRTVLL